jgi:hypothetical protein
VPDSVKDQIRGDITSLNEAMTTDDAEKVKEGLERLRTSSMDIGRSIYSQTSSEGAQEVEQQ